MYQGVVVTEVGTNHLDLSVLCSQNLSYLYVNSEIPNVPSRTVST